MAEWSKAIGCKLIDIIFVGSNPTLLMIEKMYSLNVIL
tara:strand:- start:8006 stop:8119 length:114 start_codon:yes stop_codon:yes gene_type:complete